ncbi:MAG: glycosyltransferase [Caldilineaceae bacterium]
MPRRGRARTRSTRALLAAATRQLLPDVLAAVESARPDLLLFDMSAFGPASQAGVTGFRPSPVSPTCPLLAHVAGRSALLRKFATSISPGAGHWRALLGQLRAIMTEQKLRRPADINVLSSSARLNILFLTRYFQPYASHFDDTYVYVGPTIETERREEPMVIRRAPGQTLIYIAVGTVYKAALDFFRTCMAALDDPAYAVIMSIGKAVDPASLGPIPENFTVAQYVPQLQVLQAADLFVTHGGMNSINEAVTFDVPMIVVPNTIEQSINAVRIEQLQCGRYLDHAQLTVDRLRTSVHELLADPHVADGLARLRASFAAAGGTPQAADAIEAFSRCQL